ncbi:MAG: chalcone isomerase family protein [Burkholderiales bacterium]|nr:chalcone isomerase family protein [Burkholderiales bacterium]MDE2287364.1 chalcone isomerase family protein [Burkholderiales bacterium]MDE2610602.1 chalcone isomerase family protein [Burkholderiales bacterium]
MRRFIPVLSIALLLALPPAFAAQLRGWRADVPAAQLCGQGDFRVIGFLVYTAQMWRACDAASPAAPFATPFALKLTYHRHITRARLVQSSLDEITRMAAHPIDAATLQQWRTAMQHAFVGVAPGDSITGVFLPGQGARFYADGHLTATIDDPAFAKRFFGIWLDRGTRAPDLRRQLLGRAPS